MWIYGTGVLKNTTVDLQLEVKGRHSINCLKRKDVFSHVNESVDAKKKKPKQKKGLLSLKSFKTQLAFLKLS